MPISYHLGSAIGGAQGTTEGIVQPMFISYHLGSAIRKATRALTPAPGGRTPTPPNKAYIASGPWPAGGQLRPPAASRTSCPGPDPQAVETHGAHQCRSRVEVATDITLRRATTRGTPMPPSATGWRQQTPVVQAQNISMYPPVAHSSRHLQPVRKASHPISG